MATIKDLQAQKDKNSAAWHTAATQAERDRLHQENIRLQQQIDSMSGSTSSFNPGTGKWTTVPAASATSGGSTATSGRTEAATAGIITASSGDEAIKELMSKNSQGWRDATTQEEKDWYHQANVELAGLLGGNVTFDPVSGTWSGTAASAFPPSSSTPSSSTSSFHSPVVEENDEYLEDMYAARLKEALAQLEAAYQKNLSALNASTIGVDARYQNARNQAAGASELSARNFAEYAAATGLNSGAAGQAELARNVALQNNLSTLSQDEANFYADIELQKAQAEVDYNNAIAQAQASNDYATAQALYEEKVRVQNALMQQQIYQMEYDLQQQSIASQAALQQQSIASQNALQTAQMNATNQQWQQQFDYTTQYDKTSQLISNGWTALSNGMLPSAEALAAMGITAQQAQNYINSRNLLNAVSGG